MSQGKCSTCGTTTGVKKDGDLWKHKTPDGVACEGSRAVTDHTVEATPMVFSAETSTQKPGLSIDVAQVDTSRRAESVSQSRPKTKNVYVVTIEVSANSPYIGEANWESSNKVIAYKKAKDAGEQPSGEPVCAGSEVVGNKRVLRYEVPVK